MANTYEEKFHRFTTEPVEKLIPRQALPCIVSTMITAIYNMADTFFVGQLNSNSASGAVGVVFSLMVIIQAIALFFGQGSGNFISRELGKQNYKDASSMASTALFSALFCGIALCVICLPFLQPLVLFLGATETIAPYAQDYMRFILLGAPWIMGSFVLNNQLRFQGSGVFSMMGIASGGMLNIILDPIFIFGLDMGVTGAALATATSQCFSFWVLLFGTTRGGNLRIHWNTVHFSRHQFRMIFNGGLPSLGRQGLSAVSTICLNQAAGPYGDAAIAAMSVVSRILQFGYSGMIGFGQGFQPICGFNYGAGLYSRVRQGFWFCVRTSTLFLLTLCVLGFYFAPDLVAIFRDDPDVIAFGTVALRFQCVSFCSCGWIVSSNMMLQTIGRTVPATIVAVSRQGLFLIPSILILSHFFGMTGVQMAQAVADICTVTLAIPMQLHVLRQISVPDGTKLN